MAERLTLCQERHVRQENATQWPGRLPAAAVGAYRKDTTGLVSSMLSVKESEDLLWAKELLPTYSQGAQAHCDPQLDPPPAPPDVDWDRPFAGLRCAALAAPGSTRTRPEHITDLLNVPRRCTLTRSTPLCLPSSVGSLLVRCGLCQHIRDVCVSSSSKLTVRRSTTGMVFAVRECELL